MSTNNNESYQQGYYLPSSLHTDPQVASVTVIDREQSNPLLPSLQGQYYVIGLLAMEDYGIVETADLTSSTFN